MYGRNFPGRKGLKQRFANKVAQRNRLPKHHIALIAATILTYGSYGLRVHTLVSDIDALCVAHFFASIAEDFFVLLHHMLKTRPEVSQIHCVKTVKVSFMRFKVPLMPFNLKCIRGTLKRIRGTLAVLTQ
uniref:Nuclear poly(A) polymerase 3-like n=1 Tax=Cicer arietinum TaxID=3827 RepID=A0A3Q7Y6W9_CICAR|nr:nuclear poly(A) polymerase 3-like [Cicer arietinum]